MLSCCGGAKPWAASDNAVPANIWTEVAGPARPEAAWPGQSVCQWPNGHQASPPVPQAPCLSKLWEAAAASSASAVDWQAWSLSEPSHDVLEGIRPAPPPSQASPLSLAGDPDSGSESGWAILEADLDAAAETAVTVSWQHREDSDNGLHFGNGCCPAARTGDATSGSGRFADGCYGLVGGGGGGEWEGWASE